MTVHGYGNVRVNDIELENVKKFKFLGSYITPERDSLTEIKIRSGQAKNITASKSRCGSQGI